MDRDQPGGGRALRPFADTADMAGVAQGDCRQSHRLRLLDADVDGLRRNRLAEAKAAIDDRDYRRIDEARDRLVGNEIAGLDPGDIARHADDAVAVVASEIGVDERGGDLARLLGPTADALEDLRAEIDQRIGGNVDRHVEALVCAPPR